MNVGLQFEESSGSVSVPVLVNAGSEKLTSFELVVEFDSGLLLAAGTSEGITDGSVASSFFSAPSVTLNDPVSEVLLVGNKDGSAPSGLVQLAALNLAVQPDASGSTLITSRVVGLITCVTCDGKDDNDSGGDRRCRSNLSVCSV